MADAIPRPNVRQHLRLAAQSGDFARLLDHLHQTYGPVVDVGYRFARRMTLTFGAEANEYILSTHAENFLWGEVFSMLEVVDGPTALLLSDGDDHKRRRRLVQPAFGIRKIESNLDLIIEEFDRGLASWTTGRRLDAHAEIRQTIRRIVVRGLFGARLGDLADRIGELLEPTLTYVNRSPLTRVDVDVRWNAYGRAVAARKAVDALVLEEIRRRRREGVDEDDPDTLTALLAAGSDDATEPLSDAELCDQIRSLIAAGYDTTSSSAAWLVHALGANPEVFESLRTQVLDTIGTAPPTIDDLRSMPLVDGAVRETLRLWPPGSVSLRRAIDDFDLHGHTIRGGTMVVYSPYVTHRMPELWDAPLEFRPDRWAEGEPVPFSFVPFGGGSRKCIGFALATLELQVLAVRLAQQKTWTLDNPDVRASGAASFSPKGGMPISVG